MYVPNTSNPGTCPPTAMAEKDGIKKKWLEAARAQFGIHPS
jgi:hypothetical protein